MCKPWLVTCVHNHHSTKLMWQLVEHSSAESFHRNVVLNVTTKHEKAVGYDKMCPQSLNQTMEWMHSYFMSWCDSNPLDLMYLKPRNWLLNFYFFIFFIFYYLLFKKCFGDDALFLLSFPPSLVLCSPGLSLSVCLCAAGCCFLVSLLPIILQLIMSVSANHLFI